jgi:hypothetical protein
MIVTTLRALTSASPAAPEASILRIGVGVSGLLLRWIELLSARGRISEMKFSVL